MSVSLNSLYSSPAIFFKENLSSITLQQKKILTVASMIFATLAVAYAFYHCLLKPWDATQVNGQRKILYFNRTEEGVFQKGKLHGEGKITYQDGTIEEGEFRRGLMHGLAKKTLPNKTILQGQFREGLLFWEGKMILPDGETWEGEFNFHDNLDRLEGHGKNTKSNKVAYEGEFKDSQLKRGKIFYSDGSLLKEGVFQNEQLHGQGKYIHPDGRIEEGQFQDDVLVH